VLVNDYKPEQMLDVNITMKLLLKDDEPVKTVAIIDKKDEVNKQIDEWLATGIVQPSISGYTNPIVLVTKRDER